MRAQAERLISNRAFRGDGCVLAYVLFCHLPATRLLATRHHGAYADLFMPPFGAGDTVWRPLAESALAAGIVCDRTAWSICYDDPTLTMRVNVRASRVFGRRLPER